MKLLPTLLAVLFCVAFAASAPVDEARDKRHLLVAPAPAVVSVPLIGPAPYIHGHGPVVVGTHWGGPLAYGHPTIVKYW